MVPIITIRMVTAWASPLRDGAAGTPADSDTVLKRNAMHPAAWSNSQTE